MSVYHTSFNYLNKNSNQDFGLIISHFADGADSGETETFMSMEPVYTDNAFGTKRIDYGAKYSSVAVFRITIIKQDGSELSVNNIRNYLKWLTGSRTNSSLDLLIGNEIKYSFVGRFTNAWQYKMDVRTCGLILEFTSISPWAYSPIHKVYSPTHALDENIPISGTEEFTIDNQSDDLYEYVYPRVVYKNTTGNSLTIENTTTGEITQVTGLSEGEIITMDGNLMITTDKSSKTFGNSFNFVFPRFSAGVNNLKVTGTGEITIEYIMYLKVGDCARDINVVYDPICSEDGTIQVDTLPWERVSNTPTTLNGYGITDAYTKSEVDSAIANIDIDQDFINAGSFATLGSLKAYPFVLNKSYRFYIVSSVKTVAEGQYIGSCIKIDAGEPKTLEFSNILPDGKSYYLNLDTGELTVNNIVDQTYNPTSTNAQSGVAVAEAIASIDISNIDTYTKSEIDEKLNNITTSGVDISEEELNNMLIDVLGE